MKQNILKTLITYVIPGVTAGFFFSILPRLQKASLRSVFFQK